MVTRDGGVRYLAGLITQNLSSNLSPATKAGHAPGPEQTAKRGISHSGVVQRQDAAPLRQLSGFESLRRSTRFMGP